MQPEVIDNYLDEKHFSRLQAVLMSNEFMWSFSPDVTYDDVYVPKESYFTHTFYNHRMVQSHYLTDGLLDPLLDKINTELWIRIKANLYPWTENPYTHSDHSDYPYSHKAALFSINTNDGGTNIGGEKIDSIENRIIFFDGSQKHSSTTCTDNKARININLNWLQPSEWPISEDAKTHANIHS